jgi:quercetin dioxygenase-like cupin family protein
MATYLLPWNAPLSHPAPGDTTPLPRPTTSYQFRTDVGPMTDPFDVVQQGLEFAPGAATPWHTHPGVVMVTVLAGELTFNVNGVDTVYREGESFVEVPNQLAQARNASGTPTRVMASYLIPQGAPLSSPHAGPTIPATLPRTGESDPPVLSDWLVFVALLCLVASLWVLRRSRRQHE